jgi:tricorn protease
VWKCVRGTFPWHLPIDGGLAVYPVMGIRNAQGETIIENIGISPDIEVTNHPDRMMQGHDEQLERAISELMSQLNSKEHLLDGNQVF